MRDLIRAVRKRRLVQSLRSDRELRRALDLCGQLRSQAEVAGNKALAETANFNQFLLLAQRDVRLLVADVMDSRDPYRRRLYLRILALVLYELFDDLEHLFNHKLRAQFEGLFQEQDLRLKFRSICRELAKVRKVHHRTLETIRNAVIAHREHDADRQLAVIESLDEHGLLDLGMAMNLWQGALGVLWIPVALARVEMTFRESMLKALLDSIGSGAGSTPPNKRLQPSALARS